MILVFLLGSASAPDVLSSWNLEDDDGGFVSYGDTRQWAWGEITYGPPGSSDGGNGWGTVLTGPHRSDTQDFLGLPAVDLTGAERPVLGFQHWYDIDEGGDIGRVEWYDGTDWRLLEAIYGYPAAGGYAGTSGTWVPAWFDLSGISDLSHVRLAFQADAVVALPGWYVDNLVVYDGDPVPPYIYDAEGPEDTQDVEGPYIVTAMVVDDSVVPEAAVHYRVDGGTEQSALLVEGDPWTAEIPGQTPRAEIVWWIEATDGTNDARWPRSGTQGFQVFLAAPTDLTGPVGRVIASEAEFSWIAPDSPHEVALYRVYVDGRVAVESESTDAVVPLTSGQMQVEVAALYEIGFEGEHSEPVALSAHVPEVISLSPDQAWQGDLVRVEVAGSYLLLDQDSCTLDVGEGVTVAAVEVIDVDRAEILLQVDSDAPTGIREAWLSAGGQQISWEGGFEVIDGADRPRVLSLDPDHVEQGEHATIVLQTSFALARLPVVDLGAGVIVESVELTGDDEVSIDLAVETNAPVGDHQVVLDDGRHIIDDGRLSVRDYTPPPEAVCAMPLAGPWWMALLFVARRRAGRHRPGEDR